MFYDWNWNKQRHKKRYCDDEKKEPPFRGLNLRYSDPGVLFALLTELNDDTCPPLEMKINEYLIRVTEAAIIFFVHVPRSGEDLEINVMGNTKLDETLYLPAKCDFVRRLLKSKSPIFTDDSAHIEPELLIALNKCLKKSVNERFQNLLLLPVHIGNETPFFCGVVNSSTKLGGLDRNRTLIQECLSYCKAMVRNTFILDLEKTHSEKNRNVLKTGALAFTNVEHEAELATILRNETVRILDASKAKMYFFKEWESQGFTHLIEFEEPSEKAELIPLEKTLHSFISTPEVIINKNPLESFVFPDTVDCVSNYEVRTMLSFPTFCDGEANGHVEVINKRNGKLFLKGDEEMAKCLGSIQGLAIEALWKFKNSRNRKRRADLIDCVIMRRATIHCYGVKEILACQDIHSYNYLLEFRFKPYDVEDEHTICVILGIFEELDFIRRFHLNEVSLVRFLLSLKKAHGNLPYHNWYHGFGTAHFVFMLFYSLSLLKNGVFSYIEGLSLLIGALAHDVDFRGCTTPFQVFAGDSIASLYTSAGGLQQRLGLTTILQMIVNSKCSLLVNMDSDDFKMFVNVLQLVLSDIDLINYAGRMKDVYKMTFEKYDRENPSNVRNLISLCTACAEFSDYSRPWSYFMCVHDLQMMEFYRPEERRLTDGVFDLEDCTLKSKVQVELQINFLRCFVLPTFENIYIMFPTMYSCYKIAEKNIMYLEELRDIIRKFPNSSLSDLYKMK